MLRRLDGSAKCRLIWVASTLAAMPVGLADSASAHATVRAKVGKENVTISVALRAGAGGTFAMTRGLSDSGRVRATRTIARRRLTTRQTLVGTYGTLLISSAQACGSLRGTWKVVSGTGAYAAATGGGTFRGRAACGSRAKQSTAVLTGTLEAPQLGELPSHARPALLVATDSSDRGGVATEDSADFNGDGLVDVVITRHNWRTFDTYALLVLLNNGRGGFKDGTAEIFDGPPPRLQWPRKFVLADFNNDGRPDIFVGDHGYDGPPGPGFHNTLVLSTPTNRLRDATANLPPRIRFTHSATAADVNGDGAVDLYIGSIYTDVLKDPPEIMLNDGTGRFRACTDCLPALLSARVFAGGMLQDGYTYTASQFVDVNRDGATDLVLAGNGFYRLPTDIVSSDSQVLLNDGGGHFRVSAGALPPRPWNDTGEGLDVRSADLNGDSSPDLAIAYTQTEPYYVGRYVQLLINNGNGTFRDETPSRLPQATDQGSWATQLRFIDLEGDGDDDLYVEIHEGAREPTPFYVNDGAGRFAPLPSGFGNVINNDMALADLRGDGHRDIVTSDDYAFPVINHYVVREIGAPRRPGTPTGVRVTRDPASGDAVVSWPYVWGAARYEVWRSTGGSATRIAVTRLMRHVDTTAAAGVAYSYAVRAVNGSGASRLSEAASMRLRGLTRRVQIVLNCSNGWRQLAQ